MKDQTINDWLESLGSKTPTPGGGAVAGLNGAIAAAQLNMICRYTKKELHGILDLENKIQTFLELSQNDSEAFLNIQKAYGEDNKDEIQKALALATEPSNQIIMNCVDLLKFCSKNLDIFNKNLLSDLIVVLANLRASVEASQAMLVVNAKSMILGDNKNLVEQKIKYCNDLFGEIDDLKHSVKGIIAR